MKNKLFAQALVLAAIFMMHYREIGAKDKVGISIQDTSQFEQIFILGLQGNIPSALTILDTLDAQLLTDRQQNVKQKLYTRFRTKDEEYDFKTKDSKVVNLMKLYQKYWRDALMNISMVSHFDSMLTDMVSEFLKKSYDKVKNKKRKELNENFTQYLQEFLLSRGIYAATGKTGMLFDLLMHAKETDVTYDVTTPEDTIKVKVIFMDEIISNGWEDFATMGKYYPGGWATSDALYCVKESYDINSENFLVSYLKHEGKHFADYKRFPKLGGTDLEYRAKLVELAEARKSLYSLLNFFSKNAEYDKNNPHGFANFCVIRDLSKLIFSDEHVDDLERWKSIPVDEINENSMVLLKKNTEELTKAGAETVTDFIK